MRKHLTPPMVVSLIALVVATAGTATAATLIGSAQIRNNSVRSADLRNNDVRGSDIRNGTIGTKDISTTARNALRGQTGPAGPAGATGAAGAAGAAGAKGDKGDTGAPGSALAFATVNGNPIAGDTVADAKSKNVADANVTHPDTGIYCFNGLSFTPRVVVATLLRFVGGTPPANGGVIVETLAGAETPFGGDPCPGTEQASILVRNAAGTLVDPGVGIAVIFE